MQWRALNAEAAQRKHASIPFAALKGSDVRSEAVFAGSWLKP
jgi:hypothetical protein